jgi:hypothetical protein
MGRTGFAWAGWLVMPVACGPLCQMQVNAQETTHGQDGGTTVG